MTEGSQLVYHKKSLFGVQAAFPALFLLGVLLSAVSCVFAQAFTDSVSPNTGKFRIGEKLSYNVTFGGFKNAAYFEMSVASSGKLSGRDAVELRSKVKTLEMVSAAFLQIDESRMAFVAPDTGLPIYIVKTDNSGAAPRETVSDFLTFPATSFDLLTLIYRVRESAGLGTFTFFEKDQLYTATFVAARPEKVTTESGTFDTTVSTVQSEFLTGHGITELKINFTNDEFHVPVLYRFKAAKGEFRASLSAIALAESPPAAQTQTPVPTPVTSVTPKPAPAPEVYVENRPLLPELGFLLGETLDYRVTWGGTPAGIVTLAAKERRMFQNEDSLLLTAVVTGVVPGSQALTLGDAARVQTDPDTLAPLWMESKFNSAFAGLNQTVTFDKRTGDISFPGAKAIEAPIGTHSLVSLLYAMRSFNLRPSKDPNNPVNDTRVAVFWESKAYIFTLRPSNPEEITINGERLSAQLITINTGNPELDALAPKVWLGTDSRVPLRFSIGAYQAEIITPGANLPK